MKMVESIDMIKLKLSLLTEERYLNIWLHYFQVFNFRKNDEQ